MMKRILVALNPDADSQVSTRYSIDLTKTFDARLTGLAILDVKDIQANTRGGGIGTIYYADQQRKKLEKRNRKQAENFLTKFYEAAEKAGVDYHGKVEEGVPYERIAEKMRYHDILVLGRDSHFYKNKPLKETHTLAKVIKNSVAPTLIVTNEYRNVNRLMIAYDEGSASARALQSFIYRLPFGTNIEIELVHVIDNDDKEAQQHADFLLERVEGYLNDHGFHNIERTIMVKGNKGASDRILSRLEISEPDMIVLGAHSMSAIRRATFGSTTYNLIQQSPVPLFLNN